MTDARDQRRLAAILAADVVGYSRLMGADEAGTLAALRARWKDVLTPCIARHRGRVVKVMGDGVLVEFPSAVDAVECAVAVQAGFAAANDGVPVDRRITLRIGINLGDVIVQGGDLYGDGVNIAARLEGLAEPGGVCISASVHDQVRGKVTADFGAMGPQGLKNIAEPLHVYRVLAKAPRAEPAAAAVAKPEMPSAMPSIAVLPFTNMSGDPEQAYFSDGISEDIITELSRVRELRVASSHASFRYRNGTPDPARIGRDLGVRYLLEGSVRRTGTRIRITARLADTESGTDLWAEKFDRDQEDLFAVQDEVARVIVATLVGRIEDAVTKGTNRRPPASLAAYECVMQAEVKQYINHAGLMEARQLFERAVALDPGYARAWSNLGNTYRLEWRRDLGAPDHLLDQALSHVRQALALDETQEVCHTDLGLTLMERGEWDLAEHHMRRALVLNPNYPIGIMCLAGLEASFGSADTALDLFHAARVLDPFFEPSWAWHTQGEAFFVARRYEEAIGAFRKSAPPSARTYAWIAACLACLDRIEPARQIVQETLRLAPDFTIRRYLTRTRFRHEADTRHLIEGLRRAGIPE